MSGEPHIISLVDCAAASAPLVGGKATGLGALLREGFRVPPGFAITTTAYREGLAHNRLAPALADEIRAAYAQLCGPEGPVAVRSSATAEDLADASFAGQQETYLWIKGAEQVLQHVLRCWASLFTPQAIAYRAHRNIDTDLAMGVVVQTMVPAEAAGVMLTIDPLNGDPSAIVIEASYGLGAAVVNGEVTPDRFCVDKVLLETRARSIGSKAVAYRVDEHTQGTRAEPVSPELQSQPCVTDEEVRQLAALGKRLEKTFGTAQDVEWAIGPGGKREIHLLQARPETVWSHKPRTTLTQPSTPAIERIVRTMYARRTE